MSNSSSDSMQSDLEVQSSEELSSSNSSGQSNVMSSQMFSVVSGPCEGTCDDIEVLLLQTKIVDLTRLRLAAKEDIFKGIQARVMVDGLEDNTWIVAFLSLVSVETVAEALFPKTKKALEEISKSVRIRVLFSVRFMNVEEEAVADMYSILLETLQLEEDEKILFLSAEAPVGPEEAAAIKDVFSTLSLSKRNNLFPRHTEEIFLSLHKEEPAFAHSLAAGQMHLRGYLLNMQELTTFILRLKKYYHE